MRAFTYSKPTTVVNAIRAVATGGPGARFLAGGTTMFDLMKLNVEVPDSLIDVTGIRGIDGIQTSRGRELVFGALAKMSDVAGDRHLVGDYPALSESLWKAASEQLRNMATVGGNLLQRTRCAYFRHGEPYACNKRAPGTGCAAIDGINRGHALLGGSSDCIAVYPSDWAIALSAFDAKVDVIGVSGERTIAVDDLIREPGATPHIDHTLRHDELIVRIRVPKTAAGRASTYHKIRDRESYAFALTSAAIGLDMDGDRVREARIALGGVATKPWRAREAEQALVGQRLTAATARLAGDAAFAGAKTGHHNHFRIELGARTVADALMIAKSRA